jgi:hypothetical protein
MAVMQINLLDIDGVGIAEILSEDILFLTVQDALDIMMNCSYQGASGIIINEKNLTAEFFDLKTRLAGEILQKFSTYDIRLAIVGDFSKYESKSLRDFIYESNRLKRINFVNSAEEARQVLSKK